MVFPVVVTLLLFAVVIAIVSMKEALPSNEVGSQTPVFPRPLCPRQPFPETARAYTAPWVERSVNTTLTCETPGCTGWSLMEIYDASSEEIANCHMSFAVHPTDFDDFHSGERVEFIDGNGARLHTDCFPVQSSCSTVDNPVFYCLMDISRDTAVERHRRNL